MKVILLTDVPKLGRKYEIKNVKPGFGRNYLLARGLAEFGTPAAIARAEQKRAQLVDEAALAKALKNQSLESINGQKFVVKRKANEQGHLFVGLSAVAIFKTIGQLAEGLKPEWLKLDKPIKELGEHELTLDDGEEQAHFKLIVEASS